MGPVRNAWQNAEFRDMSSTFTGFCELLGFEKVGPYMQSKDAARIEEWTSIHLDDLGKGIQEQMTKRFQVRTTNFDELLFLICNNSNSLYAGRRPCLLFQPRNSNEQILHMNWDVLFGGT